MFWKFNFIESTSHIDTLLGNEDVTLHELMDEDDILQECKAQNKKLIEFVSQTDQMTTMIDLIVKEPDDQQDEQFKYKYSNTACDVLTADVIQINEQLVANEHLVKLYNFLESDQPLNPLLASFFSKVMGVLITRKSELIFDYLKGKEDFVGTLLRHIDTSAIMDLLLRLITCIEAPQTRLDVITWLNEQKLVEKLISKIVYTECDEVHCNASQSLCDIIRISRDRMSHLQENADPDPLLETIESKEMVSELLSNMLSGDRTESCLVNGLAVMQNLLEFRKSNVEGEPLTALDAERISSSVQNVLEAVQPRLIDLHSILSHPPKQHYCVMQTTAGRLDPPLGNSRIQAVRLINSLISTNMHEINVELTNLGTVKLILELFFQYQWNNFLHSQVEQCVCTILRNVVAVVDEKIENPLLAQMIVDYKLLNRIIDAWEDNENSQNHGSCHRKGYMGHLTRIANDIQDLIASADKSVDLESNLHEYYDELSAEDHDRWEKFTSGSLAEINNLSVLDTVPTNTMPSSNSDEDDDSFKNIPFQHDTALQQAFSDYQLRQMTTNFIDQVGFNEEEFLEQEAKADAYFSSRISSIDFTQHAENEDGSPQKPSNETNFERAFESRIQQFDDDSDEDIWEEKEITYHDTTQIKRERLFSTKQESSKDEDSSDSEEDLDSVPVIRQLEMSEKMEIKMEIDSMEALNPSDLSNPVAMDIGNPWESNAHSNSSPDDDASATLNWASFTETNGDTSAPNWADFTALKIPQDNNASPTTVLEDFAAFTAFASTKKTEISITERSNTKIEVTNGSGDSSNMNSSNAVAMATDELLVSTADTNCTDSSQTAVTETCTHSDQDELNANYSHQTVAETPSKPFLCSSPDATNERLYSDSDVNHDRSHDDTTQSFVSSPDSHTTKLGVLATDDQPMTSLPTEPSQNGPV